MPITVHILTTQGPVRIQRIAEEQPGIQSVMCLDGRAQALPISSGYDAFVRNPTGVIERETGHNAYRIDVDGPVDAGDSWQLGIYTAHMVKEFDVHDDVHIFATGEVDRDLNVRPVGHVAEKLLYADKIMSELVERGASVFIFVPADGTADSNLRNDIPLLMVENVRQVFEHLNVPFPQPLKNSRNLDAGLFQQSFRKQYLIFGAPFIFLFGWFLWAPFVWIGLANEGKVLELEREIVESASSIVGRYQLVTFSLIQDWRRPADVNVELTGEVTIAPAPRACRDKDARQEVSWMSEISQADTICRIVVIGDDRDISWTLVGRMGYWPKGLGRGGKPERTMRGSARANGHTWKLEFEKFPDSESVIRLVTLHGLAVPVGSQPWYASLLSEPADSNAFRTAKARIERLGYHVTVQDWQRP